MHNEEPIMQQPGDKKPGDDGTLTDLSSRFREKHERRAAEIEGGLGTALSSAELLTRLASHEAALLERIIELESQVLQRGLLMVDRPATSEKLLGELKPILGTHRNVAERVESFLAAAAALRAAESTPATSHLRRVA